MVREFRPQEVKKAFALNAYRTFYAVQAVAEHIKTEDALSTSAQSPKDCDTFQQSKTG